MLADADLLLGGGMIVLWFDVQNKSAIEAQT